MQLDAGYLLVGVDAEKDLRTRGQRKQICHDFENNKCTRGISCKFSHVLDTLGGGKGGGGKDGRGKDRDGRKGGGHDHRDGSIKGAGKRDDRRDHDRRGFDDRRERDDRRGAGGPRSPGRDGGKGPRDAGVRRRAGGPARDKNGNELCGDFKMGTCFRGRGCKYSHDVPTEVIRCRVFLEL